MGRDIFNYMHNRKVLSELSFVLIKSRLFGSVVAKKTASLPGYLQDVSVCSVVHSVKKVSFSLVLRWNGKTIARFVKTMPI